VIRRSCGVDCGRVDAQILSSSTTDATIWPLRQRVRAPNSVFPSV